MDDTTTTRIVKLARGNWKIALGLLASLITGIIGASVGWGGYVERLSNDHSAITRTESKVDALSEQVAKLSLIIAANSSLTTELQSDVHELRGNWDDAAHTVDTFRVPVQRPRRATSRK